MQTGESAISELSCLDNYNILRKAALCSFVDFVSLYQVQKSGVFVSSVNLLPGVSACSHGVKVHMLGFAPFVHHMH